MNPMETARELGGGLIESFKGSPALLVLVLFMAGYIALNYFSQNDERARWKDLVEAAMRWCPANTYPAIQPGQPPPAPPPR